MHGMAVRLRSLQELAVAQAGFHSEADLEHGLSGRA